MKKTLLSLMIVSLLASLAQAQTEFREVDFKINGLRSGSPYSLVIAKLGKPIKQSSEKTWAEEGSCLASDSTLLSLQYPGLELVLLGDGAGKNLKVVEMTLLSGRWAASGIGLGATPEQVRKRFGDPVSTGKEGKKMTFFYVTPGNFGGVKFGFTNRKLTLVGMSEAIC